MHELKQLDGLSKEEKIQFFQKCQDLLLKNQPTSEFVLAADSQSRDYFLDLFLKYKGFVYHSDNVAVLFNKHRINSLPEIQDTYQDVVFTPPCPNPNTYTVDFITAVMNKELLGELIPIFSDENIKYICFLRGGKVSLLPFEKFRASLIDQFEF